MDNLQFLRQNDNQQRRWQNAERIAAATEQNNRHQQQRIAKVKTRGGDKAGHHGVGTSSDAGQTITYRKRKYLPARYVDSERRRSRFIGAYGIEIQSDPGAFQALDQNVCTNSKQQGNHRIGCIEGNRTQWAEGNIVIERPTEQLHPGHFEPLRPAEYVTDLEKRAEQDAKCNRHQCRVMTSCSE